MIQTVHTWANIALIFLILISLLVWAIPLFLLFFSVRGMHRVHRRVESLMPRAQQRAQGVAHSVARGGHRIARPLIRVHAWWAGTRAAWRVLCRPFHTSASHPDDDEVTE